MLCPYCHGLRIVITKGQLQPCDECSGLGEINCCEGLQAQPEPQPPVREAAHAADETRAEDKTSGV